MENLKECPVCGSKEIRQARNGRYNNVSKETIVVNNIKRRF